MTAPADQPAKRLPTIVVLGIGLGVIAIAWAGVWIAPRNDRLDKVEAPKSSFEQESKWPRTVEEAVTRILAGMSDKDKALVKATAKEDLIEFHHGWGTGIRNRFGLWSGNKELLADCHAKEPDEASMVIIEAVWQKLQEGESKKP